MNTRKLLNTVFIVGMSMALPLSSFAAQSNTALDTNGAGHVTPAELTALFAKIDTNTDTYLSLSEVQAWRESAQVEHFNTLDTDKSTHLSLAELQAEVTRMPPGAMSSNLFALLDADKNNTLSWEEFSVMEAGKGEMIRHFAGMDSDSDSKISQTEFLTSKPSHPGPDGSNHGGRGQ